MIDESQARATGHAPSPQGGPDADAIEKVRQRLERAKAAGVLSEEDADVLLAQLGPRPAAPAAPGPWWLKGGGQVVSAPQTSVPEPTAPAPAQSGGESDTVAGPWWQDPSTEGDDPWDTASLEGVPAFESDSAPEAADGDGLSDDDLIDAFLGGEAPAPAPDMAVPGPEWYAGKKAPQRAPQKPMAKPAPATDALAESFVWSSEPTPDTTRVMEVPEELRALMEDDSSPAPAPAGASVAPASAEPAADTSSAEPLWDSPEFEAATGTQGGELAFDLASPTNWGDLEDPEHVPAPQRVDKAAVAEDARSASSRVQLGPEESEPAEPLSMEDDTDAFGISEVAEEANAFLASLTGHVEIDDPFLPAEAVDEPETLPAEPTNLGGFSAQLHGGDPLAEEEVSFDNIPTESMETESAADAVGWPGNLAALSAEAAPKPIPEIDDFSDLGGETFSLDLSASTYGHQLSAEVKLAEQGVGGEAAPMRLPSSGRAIAPPPPLVAGPGLHDPHGIQDLPERPADLQPIQPPPLPEAPGLDLSPESLPELGSLEEPLIGERLLLAIDAHFRSHLGRLKRAAEGSGSTHPVGDDEDLTLPEAAFLKALASVSRSEAAPEALPPVDAPWEKLTRAAGVVGADRRRFAVVAGGGAVALMLAVLALPSLPVGLEGIFGADQIEEPVPHYKRVVTEVDDQDAPDEALADDEAEEGLTAEADGVASEDAEPSPRARKSKPKGKLGEKLKGKPMPEVEAQPRQQVEEPTPIQEALVMVPVVGAPNSGELEAEELHRELESLLWEAGHHRENFDYRAAVALYERGLDMAPRVDDSGLRRELIDGARSAFLLRAEMILKDVYLVESDCEEARRLLIRARDLGANEEAVQGYMDSAVRCYNGTTVPQNKQRRR